LPVKGIRFLIKALSELVEEDKRDDVVLFLIGSGSDKDDLAALTKELKIENKVFFLGKKAHSEVPLWLNIADVFVLPSISEGFPTIIPEVMMCGVPIVASDVGGISEAIIDEKSGLLVHPGDVEQIKCSIRRFLNDESLRKSVIAAAYEYAEKYTWDNNAAESMSEYELMLQNCQQKEVQKHD